MPSPYVIAIDPGHGGSPTSDPTQLWDPGVVVGNVMEKDITLDLAFRLRTLLQKERVKVVLTRTGDEYVEISERWNRVHASGARLFVSLHVNAFNGDPAINGATIFYPKPDSLSFAQAIDAGLAQTLKGYQIADDGVAAKPELWVDAARTATASRWGLILGAIVVLWFVMRLAIRRQVGAPQLPQYRRRSYRRRRATSRRN